LKKLLRTARNCHILHMAVEWINVDIISKCSRFFFVSQVIGRNLETTSRVFFITSVKLISDDDKERDTSAETIQSDSYGADDESGSPTDSFQNIL
jgi:hypothetical protein